MFQNTTSILKFCNYKKRITDPLNKIILYRNITTTSHIRLIKDLMPYVDIT